MQDPVMHGSVEAVNPAAHGAAPLGPGDPQYLGAYRVLGRFGADNRGLMYLGVSEAGLAVGLRVPDRRWLADPRNRAAIARTMVAGRRAAPVPGVIRMLDADLHAPVPYVVGEYCGGAPLGVMVARLGPLGPVGAEELAVQVLTVLQGLHALRVEHRNVSPSTVMVGSLGTVLMDPGFGLPVGEGSEEAWRFAAPEQMRGDAGGAATDLFSWAATVAFAASGRAPFGWLTASKFLELTDASSADLADLAPPLRDLVRDCLDLNPRVRPTATEALGRFAPTQVASTAADLVGRIPGRRSPG